MNTAPHRRSPLRPGRSAVASRRAPVPLPVFVLVALLALGAVLALVAPTPARAAVGSWSASGPEGGLASSFAVAADGTFFAAASGLYRSLDEGQTWEPVTAGLGGEVVRAVAAAPSDPTVLWAAVDGGFALRSTDGGATWSRRTRTEPGFRPQALAVHPSDPSVVVVGAESGWARTTDGGETWTLGQRLPPSQFEDAVDRVTAVAFDPTDPGQVWAVALEAGVYRSDDGGVTWTEVGPPSGSNIDGGVGLAVDGATGTVWVPLSDTLVRSDDDGASWQTVPVRPDESRFFPVSITLDSRPGVLWLGAASVETVGGDARSLRQVLRSDDGGATWELVDSTVGSSLVGPVLAPGGGLALYSSFDFGLRRSDDDGATWAPPRQNLVAVRVQALAASSVGPRRLWSSAGSFGLQVSGDRGATWNRVGSFPAPLVEELVTVPVDPDGIGPSPPRSEVFTGAQAVGVLHSVDLGRTWTNLVPEEEPRGSRLRAGEPLAVDPDDPSALVTGTPFVYRTTDGGATWTRGDAIGSTDLTRLEIVDGRLYAAGVRRPDSPVGGVVAVSDDLGATLERVGPPGERAVHDLAVDALGGVLWAAGSEGLWRHALPADGSGWTLAAPFLLDVPLGSVLVDPFAPDTLWVGSLVDPDDPNLSRRLAQVAVSRDGGDTWRTLNAGLPTGDVRELVLDPRAPGTIYAAVGTSGVWTYTVPGTPPGQVPPPRGEPLRSAELPGFSFWVQITSPQGDVFEGRSEADCIAETLCVSGALAGRTEVFLRLIGPRPNGFLWSTITRFTPSRVDVWIHQDGSEALRAYRLDAVGPGDESLSGLQDRDAFRPLD